MSTTEQRNDTTGQHNPWLALAVLLSGAFMALLDTTIVNVALPSIRTALSTSNAALSWIVSGYALAFGLALIPAGRVGDRIGHKPVFITGLSVFTVASAGCGLAHDQLEVIVARAIQGLGGGIFYASITALIQLMFSAHERGRAFAITGATIGLSTALGPLAGGLIIEGFGAEHGWRLVFDVNIPIGVVALIAAARLLPGGAENRSLRTDWVGLGLLSAGLVAILTPLIEGQQTGWPLWTYVSLGAGLILLATLGGWELRVQRSHGDPLVPPRLFAHPSFTAGVALALVYFAAFTSIFFTLALLWQAGLGRSALQSGLVATPFALGSMIGAARSDTLAARFGRVALNMGLGLVAVGITAVWIVLAVTTSAGYSGWQLFAPLLVAGVGSGLFIAPNADFIVATVDRADAGAASGVIGTVQRIGSAIGIAVIGTVLFGTLHIAPSPDGVASGFAHSATIAMGVSAALAVAAFAFGFALPRQIGVNQRAAQP